MADAFDRVGAELQPLHPDGIPAADLRRRAHELTGYKPESLLPSDFCYNRTNRGIRRPPDNNPVFLWLREGFYRYVGRRFPYHGPVDGTPQGGPAGGRFVTSRGYPLPATAEEMVASPWFNLWQRRLWPYRELEPGDTLYWYDATEQAVVWASRVSRVERFEYDSKEAARQQLRTIFDDPHLSHPYLDKAAETGYCLAYQVDQVRPLRVPRSAGYRFPQDGWLRCDDEAARDWVSNFPPHTDHDGPAAADLVRAGAAVAESGYFSPAPGRDERERVLREIVERRGQAEFRTRLLAAYGGRCAVTGFDAAAALEAAHLDPYSGPATQHVTNGVLLRADLHTLFDLDLIGIDPDSMKVALAPAIRTSSYADLDGVPFRRPAALGDNPDRDALARRWQRFIGGGGLDEYRAG